MVGNEKRHRVVQWKICRSLGLASTIADPPCADADSGIVLTSRGYQFIAILRQLHPILLVVLLRVEPRRANLQPKRKVASAYGQVGINGDGLYPDAGFRGAIINQLAGKAENNGKLKSGNNQGSRIHCPPPAAARAIKSVRRRCSTQPPARKITPSKMSPI